MKFIKALVLLTFVASSQVLFAQQPTLKKQKDRPERSQQRSMADAATRAKKMTDRMTQQLGLDETTAKKLYDITLARANKVDQIQASTDDGKTKNEALKVIADDFKVKLKGMLTTDQFAKFEAMKKEVKDARGEGGKPRKGERGRRK